MECEPSLDTVKGRKFDGENFLYILGNMYLTLNQLMTGSHSLVCMEARSSGSAWRYLVGSVWGGYTLGRSNIIMKTVLDVYTCKISHTHICTHRLVVG